MARALNYGYTTPPSPSPTRATPVPAGGTNISRRGTPSVPTPKVPVPSQADLINQQPLPVDQSAQYQQMLDQYNASMAAMQGYGGQINQMQQQLNRGYAADPGRFAMQRLMGMYGEDPLAAYREQLAEMYRPQPRANRLIYGFGF